MIDQNKTEVAIWLSVIIKSHRLWFNKIKLSTFNLHVSE